MQKAFRNYFFLLMMTLGLSAQCFAQNLKMTYDGSQTSDNYYVQPGGVYVSPDGIFILFEEQLIQVNILCADERGVFVPGSEMSRQFVRCPLRYYDPERPQDHKCRGY